MSRRRAVITGIGTINPLGHDLVTFWEALHQGRSGVARLRSFDVSHLPVQFGGEVLGFDPRNYLEKKDRKRLAIMARTFQLGVAASQLALDDASLDPNQVDPTRFGVIFGSATVPDEMKDMGPAAQASTTRNKKEVGRGDRLESNLVDLRIWGECGLALIPPMWMLTHIPNMGASHVSILHNAQGPINTITQTDVAGPLAIGEAVRAIRNNRADIFLVGGGDTLVCPVNFIRHTLFSTLSRRNQAPHQACRPFDLQRDGRVLGEGSGVFLVEELEHARGRGARIYAEILGFGTAFDRGCTGKGLARAIHTALTQAQITIREIDHINAHGASTRFDDAWEAKGLGEVFGSPTPPVFAAKSYFGSLGAASSFVELAASLLAQENGLLPATLNYEQPDPDCPLTVVRSPQPTCKPYFLKISCTEMAQTAALVCRQWGR